MKYLIALQFPANSLADYDELIAIEDALIEAVDTSAKVDGHDCGSGEMNIFIHADEPEKAFNRIRPVLAKRKSFDKLVAAYREAKGEEYKILWPIGLNKPFTIK